MEDIKRRVAELAALSLDSANAPTDVAFEDAPIVVLLKATLGEAMEKFRAERTALERLSQKIDRAREMNDPLDALEAEQGMLQASVHEWRSTLPMLEAKIQQARDRWAAAAD